MWQPAVLIPQHDSDALCFFELGLLFVVESCAQNRVFSVQDFIPKNQLAVDTFDLATGRQAFRLFKTGISLPANAGRIILLGLGLGREAFFDYTALSRNIGGKM